MYLQPRTGRGGPGEIEHTGLILWTWRRDSEREQNITISLGSISNRIDSELKVSPQPVE